MAEIVFNKDDNKWVAEFEVSADFNLHIEKAQIGYLYMQQRSTSGKWDSVRNFQVAENDYIVDYDFAALVYPKQIRLVSEYAPTMCVLTSDGDVIEIKSQSKEVEITQNGEISVTPDDGFAYLSSVNVKTNVPQQGGGESGGGSESGGNQVVYLNVVPFKDAAGDMWEMSLRAIPGLLAVRATKDWVIICPLSALAESYISDISEVAILSDFRGFIEQSNDINSSSAITMLVDQGAVEITKEEFYNLES